jgi:hypothetical protein
VLDTWNASPQAFDYLSPVFGARPGVGSAEHGLTGPAFRSRSEPEVLVLGNTRVTKDFENALAAPRLWFTRCQPSKIRIGKRLTRVYVEPRSHCVSERMSSHELRESL